MFCTIIFRVGVGWVSFELPIAASAEFPHLLGALEAGKRNGSLRILEFGVSVTTMEEVFIKVARGEVDSQTQAAAMDDVRRTMSLRRSTLRSLSSASVPESLRLPTVSLHDDSADPGGLPGGEGGVEMRLHSTTAASRKHTDGQCGR